MFNEQNTVENFIRDVLCGAPHPATGGGRGVGQIGEEAAPYIPLGRNSRGSGWYYVSALSLPRRINDVFIEAYLRDALIRLNAEIAEVPDRAEQVIQKLRAITLSVRSDGLIRANEEFTAWLRGERSMPFGENNQHVT